MDLTPEEKERIYQEEKVRHEAQEKIKQEQEANTNKDRKGCLAVLGILGGLLVVAVVLISSGWCGTSKEIKLKAMVYFIGDEMIVHNQDDFDWTNVKLTVNFGFEKSSYRTSVPLIKAGQVLTVGAMLFAKDDGTRFNPFTTKAQNMSIHCDTSKGEGDYYANVKWK